jgi:hypothetical protein
MSKNIERRILDQVYGRTPGWTVLPHESPDFLCRRIDSVILGVEVTEYFHFESDARLQRIPGYAKELLGVRRYRHSNDKNSLRVEKITYLPGGDETKGIEFDAIIRKVPQLTERLGKLSSIVDSKADKFVAYSKNTPIVDLVVYDSNHAFLFEKFADFYCPLSASDVRSRIIVSPFREVFLVTLGSDDKRVCVPLKANAFVEEIMICERLFVTQGHDQSHGLDLASFLSSLIYVLSYSGFGDARLRLKDGEVHLQFSSIEFVYSRDGKRINDFTPLPDYCNIGETVKALAGDLTEEERIRSAQIQDSREEYMSCMDLFFPTHAEL